MALCVSMGCGRVGYDGVPVAATGGDTDGPRSSVGLDAGSDGGRTDASKAAEDGRRLDGGATTGTDTLGPDGSTTEAGASVDAPVAADATPNVDRSGTDLAPAAEPDASPEAAVPDLPPDVAPAVDVAEDATPPAAGPARSCSEISGALACNDFESPVATWGPQDLGMGTVERGATHVRQGSFALRARSSVASDYALQVVTLASRLTSGDLHARAFFFVPSSVRLDDWVVALEMKACDTCTEKISFDLAHADTAMLSITGAASVKSAPGVLPRDRWFCVELAAVLSRSGSATLSLDGKTVATMSNVDTLLGKGASAGVGAFRIGFIAGPNQGTADLWADVLVSSTQPVGCN